MRHKLALIALLTLLLGGCAMSSQLTISYQHDDSKIEYSLLSESH